MSKSETGEQAKGIPASAVFTVVGIAWLVAQIIAIKYSGLTIWRTGSLVFALALCFGSSAKRRMSSTKGKADKLPYLVREHNGKQYHDYRSTGIKAFMPLFVFLGICAGMAVVILPSIHHH